MRASLAPARLASSKVLSIASVSLAAGAREKWALSWRTKSFAAAAVAAARAAAGEAADEGADDDDDDEDDDDEDEDDILARGGARACGRAAPAGRRRARAGTRLSDSSCARS